MKRLRRVRTRIKKALTGLLAAAVIVSNGYGLFAAPVEAEAAAAEILSDDERGIIYANSRTDFRDESIYFLIVTRFYDGDPSNNARTSEDDNKAHNPEDDPSWRGDFAGLIEKLDYIKALGFTAIWITPVVQNDSGYDYHGYHAYNFSAVDTRYESNGVTYQDLIDAVHAKGMKLIQDIVLNHTCNWGEENLLQITDPVYGGGRSEVVNSGKYDTENIYHHNGFCGGSDWDNYSAQDKTIADDCFDLETENPKVYNYLVDCYTKYINMGVDAFRVDTVKHISRLTFNSVFLPAFKKAGGDNFYMFGEVCTKGHDVWYREQPGISTCFYTWADSDEWLNRWSTDLASNEALVQEHYTAHGDTNNQPTSTNAFLNGNEYHTPDYSEKSGMDVIDFQMHWSFMSAKNAFNMALKEDKYFNDSTWNVVYVDSHDYAPDECQTQRYTGGTDAWAENLSLMFTFRGIPCLYYGSEIEFQAGKPIDVGPSTQLANTGRAYYGDHIEGDLTATDFTVFGNVSGEVGNTLNATLSQHIMRLNRLRQAIPALRKGQYSVDGCSGNMAFKRRYTDSTTDSFCLVAISGNATFTGIPNGKYVDAVTGDVKNVTNGTLSASVSGKGNMKVYVLDTAKTPAPGRVITNGTYLTDGGAAELIGPVDIDIIEPTAITVDKTSVTVLEGSTVTVKATIAPSNATKKTVTWSTSDASVAKVSGGIITGISPGKATITAKTTNGLTATVQVTVSENPDIVKPTGITISKKTLTLTEGEDETLTATVLPSNATNKTVTWTSSDTSIATVSSAGKVTAVAEGTAIITVSTFNGYKETATVTVEAKEIPIIENGIYFEKPSNWGTNINVYLYSSATNSTVGEAWPGTAMTNLGDGIYGLSYKSSDSNLMVVFNDGSNQTGDLEFVNNGLYNSSGFVRVVTPRDKGKVIVRYMDESGSLLSSQTITGEVGTNYQTSAKTFEGYTLKTTPSNAKGTYTKEDIIVTYVYIQSINELKISAKASSSTVAVGANVTITGTADGGSGSYTYSFLMHNKDTGDWYRFSDFKASNTLTWLASSAGNREFYVEVKDSTGKVARSSGVNVSVSAVSIPLAITGKSNVSTVSVGENVTITGTADGGSGSYTYSFLMRNKDTGDWYRFSDFKASNTLTWTASSAGNREFYVEVKDGTGKVVRSQAVTVAVTEAKPLSITGKVNISTVSVGAKVTFTGKASGGSGNYTYSYLMTNKDTGKWYRFSDFKASNTLTWTASSAGNREFYVEVKDSTGKVVRSSGISVKVTGTTPLSIVGTTSAVEIGVETTILLTGRASGGSGKYTYSFLLNNKDTGEWYRFSDFKEANQLSWTATSAGNRAFYIEVKDGTGAVVRSSAINVKVTD